VNAGTTGADDVLDLSAAGRRTRENLAGIPLKPYDLLREGAVVFAFVLVVVVVLSIVFKAPDYPTVNAQNVATQQPLAFVQSAAGILANDGEVSAVSGYGPPYDGDTSAAQHFGPINPAAWAKDIFGVTIPINPPQDLIIKPLRRAAVLDPALASALASYEAAPSAQQAAWLAAYRKAFASATVSGGTVMVPPGNYGPVPQLMDGMLSLGRSGLLEGALAADGNSYYPYNFDVTKALLFFAIASPYTDTASHLQQLGNPQWGIVHETGNYPGAWWLDVYQVWYEVPQIANSPNADLIVVTIMTVLFVVLLTLPFIPGLRRIPHGVKVYRLIWRSWYRDYAHEARRPQAIGH
jgi:fumarate reductase subunit D